jgi:hypothetical protein
MLLYINHCCYGQDVMFDVRVQSQFCSLMCCLKGSLEGKCAVYVPYVPAGDRTLLVNKTDVGFVATCISSSVELYQIHHTKLVFSLLLEGDSDLSNIFICRPKKKRLLNVNV